jgi:hypothetical protein
LCLWEPYFFGSKVRKTSDQVLKSHTKKRGGIRNGTALLVYGQGVPGIEDTAHICNRRSVFRIETITHTYDPGAKALTPTNSNRDIERKLAPGIA